MSSSENDNAMATALLNLGKEMGNAGLPTVTVLTVTLRFWDPKYGVTARLKSVTLFWSSEKNYFRYKKLSEKVSKRQ